MIIAVNTRLNKATQPEGYQDFLVSILYELCKQNPQHQFLLIADRHNQCLNKFADNAMPVITGPTIKSRIGLHFWFNYKIPAVLRKYRADVFVSLEGIGSLKSKVPQFLVLSDLRFLNSSSSIQNLQTRYAKKYTRIFIFKTKGIATLSENAKKLWLQQYRLNANDLHIIPVGINKAYVPVDWESKEQIREEYADGKAYFLCNSQAQETDKLVNLLKAFSFFKKRQKSNMLLLVTGQTSEVFKKDLKTFKFREEVKLYENLSTAAETKVMAAAYALVHPFIYSDLAQAPLQAMACCIPVITTHSDPSSPDYGDAALYANPNSFQDMAEKMMQVYKDENLSASLVNAGLQLVQKHRIPDSAALLMQHIQDTVNR